MLGDELYVCGIFVIFFLLFFWTNFDSFVFVCIECEWVRVWMCLCVWLRECVLDYAISTNFKCTTRVEIHFVSFENFLLRFSCVPFNARKTISNAYHLHAAQAFSELINLSYFCYCTSFRQCSLLLRQYAVWFCFCFLRLKSRRLHVASSAEFQCNWNERKIDD